MSQIRRVKSTLLESVDDIDLAEIIARQSRGLVKGVLYPRDAAISYGESTVGKSFGVLDMCWHIAQGKPWHGRKTTRAPVLYVALEGVDGFRKRMVAAKHTHGNPGAWFRRLAVDVTLVTKKHGEAGVAKIVEAAAELAAECKQAVGVIVIDTVARAIAGESQNDSETVMAFVERRMGAIQKATGAAVMVVHHTNRAGDMRGSLDWRTSMDVVLRWEQGDKDGPRTCVAEKVKDGPKCTLFAFVLETVYLGEDADGEVVDSCVVRRTAESTRPEKAKEGKHQRAFLAAYHVARLKGRNGPVLLPDVRDSFMAAYPADGERDPKKVRAAARQAWARALKEPPAVLEIYARGGVEYVRRVDTSDADAEFEVIDLTCDSRDKA